MDEMFNKKIQDNITANDNRLRVWKIVMKNN